MQILKDFGKREALIYIIVFLWISVGLFAFSMAANLSDLAVYFGSLTTYAATYIWAETKRPSTKSGILKSGISSRREIMIYVVVVLWAIAGLGAIYFTVDLKELSVYFFSLTGFVTSWLAGEVFKPEDEVNKKLE